MNVATADSISANETCFGLDSVQEAGAAGLLVSAADPSCPEKLGDSGEADVLQLQLGKLGSLGSRSCPRECHAVSHWAAPDGCQRLASQEVDSIAVRSPLPEGPDCSW